MALTVYSLLAQTLPLSGTPASFTPGSGKGAVIKSILFVNTTGTAITVTGKLNKASSSANVCPPAMSVPGLSSVSLDTELTLSDSDSLTFFASVNPGLDCIVSGMVRDN